MRSLITSYLLQNKECRLSGIGMLRIISTPATSDTANNLLQPPFDGIIFTAGTDSFSTGLIDYIAKKNQISTKESEIELNEFCKEWKEKIKRGEILTLDIVGSIKKNDDGLMIFEKERSFNLLKPIPVNDLYQKNNEPSPIAEEQTITDINEFEEKETVIVEKTNWAFWAIILLAVGFVFIFYHFKDHAFSGSTIGNQKKPIIDSAAAGYYIPK